MACRGEEAWLVIVYLSNDLVFPSGAVRNKAHRLYIVGTDTRNKSQTNQPLTSHTASLPY